MSPLFWTALLNDCWDLIAFPIVLSGEMAWVLRDRVFFYVKRLFVTKLKR